MELKEKPKYIERRLPCQRLDLQKIENYLAEMALKGYMVMQIEKKAVFQVCSPKKLWFRIDPVAYEYENFDRKPKAEDGCIFEEEGWTNLGPYLEVFAIFYKDMEDSTFDEQPLMDRRVYSEHGQECFLRDEKLHKRMKRIYGWEKAAATFAAAYVFLTVVLINIFSPHPSYEYLFSNLFFVYLALMVKGYLCTCEWLKERTYVETLYCMYYRGNYCTSKIKEPKKKSKMKEVVREAILVGFAFVFIGALCIQLQPNSKGTLDDQRNVLANVRLCNMEMQEESMSYNGDYTYDRNSFFVPVQIHTREHGTSSKYEYPLNEENHDSNKSNSLPTETDTTSRNGKYSSHLEINYYELRFRNLTKRFFIDLFDDKLNDADSIQTIKTEPGMIFYYAQKDYEYLVKPDYLQYLIGYYKNKVIYAEYIGRDDVKDLIPHIIENFKIE